MSAKLDRIGDMQGRVGKETKRRVLVVQAVAVQNGRRQVAGMRAYAAQHGWKLIFTEGTPFGQTIDFLETIRHWKPDGLLLDPFYAYENDVRNIAGGVPAVIWDAEAFPLSWSGCGKTCSDSLAVSKAAFSELMRGNPCQLAYVSAFGSFRWSIDRGKAFSELSRNARIRCDVFAPPAMSARGRRPFRRELKDFISSLTYPCGVMAANDATAAVIIEACDACGIRIPDEVTIVGVDDNPDFCEFLNPTLSSVRIDVEYGGWQAAKLLDNMMSGRNPSDQPVRYGVEKVVRRASTQGASVQDVRIRRALEYIRLHASQGINVADVVFEMGCSRRLIDQLFRTKLGESVLDRIHAVRIERACELLLHGDVKIDNIAAACGYARGPYFKRLFKRKMGFTMQEWKKRKIAECIR